MQVLRSAATAQQWVGYARTRRRRTAQTGTFGTTLWEINHVFLAPAQLLAPMIDDLEALGYEVRSERMIIRYRVTASVRAFIEPDSVEVSDETVASLVRVAGDSLGDYRGWSTRVVAELQP